MEKTVQDLPPTITIEKRENTNKVFLDIVQQASYDCDH